MTEYFAFRKQCFEICETIWGKWGLGNNRNGDNDIIFVGQKTYKVQKKTLVCVMSNYECGKTFACQETKVSFSSQDACLTFLRKVLFKGFSSVANIMLSLSKDVHETQYKQTHLCLTKLQRI